MAGMLASEKLSAVQGGFKKGLMDSVREFVVDAKEFR
jgi:hypothetical protein